MQRTEFKRRNIEKAMKKKTRKSNEIFQINNESSYEIIDWQADNHRLGGFLFLKQQVHEQLTVVGRRICTNTCFMVAGLEKYLSQREKFCVTALGLLIWPLPPDLSQFFSKC